MRPISVLIPTANQPKLLKTALQSVARQTAADQIEEVLISENLMNRESEAVCGQFKDLPIRYIFQDPPVSVPQHFTFLFDQVRAGLVAVMCDDDWWVQVISRGRLMRGSATSQASVEHSDSRLDS